MIVQYVENGIQGEELREESVLLSEICFVILVRRSTRQIVDCRSCNVDTNMRIYNVVTRQDTNIPQVYQSDTRQITRYARLLTGLDMSIHIYSHRRTYI